MIYMKYIIMYQPARISSLIHYGTFVINRNNLFFADICNCIMSLMKNTIPFFSIGKIMMIITTMKMCYKVIMVGRIPVFWIQNCLCCYAAMSQFLLPSRHLLRCRYRNVKSIAYHCLVKGINSRVVVHVLEIYTFRNEFKIWFYKIIKTLMKCVDHLLLLLLHLLITSFPNLKKTILIVTMMMIASPLQQPRKKHLLQIF
mmetsp:Transcript_26480/g.38981  ORF Transcript_26480/g.38981 Transcript_26480/m.38981 type:complete len:200 (+) Transcript_26480:321-920(+)